MLAAFPRKAVGKLDAYLSNLWMAGGIDTLVGGYPFSMYVENTSDGRDTAIQFNADGSINSGQLLGHCPSAGTAQALIDQSFSDRYFGNSTSSGQPAIVASSAYLGWLQFDGSNDGIFSTVNYGGVPAITIFLKGKLRSTAGYHFLFELTTNVNTGDAFVVYYDGSISRLVVASHQNTGARLALSEFNVTVTTDAVFCFRIDRAQATGAAQCVMFLNGVKQTRTGSTGETSPVPSGNFASSTIYLGSRGQASLFAALNLKDTAIYSAALSDGDCTAISALL